MQGQRESAPIWERVIHEIPQRARGGQNLVEARLQARICCVRRGLAPVTRQPAGPRHEDLFAFGIKNLSENWQLGLSCLLDAEKMAADSGDNWSAANYARIAATYLQRYCGLEAALRAVERTIEYCPEDAQNYQSAGHLCFLACGLSSAFPGNGP